MIGRSLLVTIWALVVVLPAAAQQTPTPSEMVQALERKFEVTFVNEDATGLAEFFARDAIIIPSSGPMAIGGDILRFYQNLFAEYAKGGRKPSAFTLQIVQSQELSANLVLLTGHWTSPIRNADGTTTTIGGDFARLWEREGDAWKMRYGGWNRVAR